MDLSAHFKIAEFCRSQTAARMGMLINPTESDIENLKRLCETVLEPLRSEIGPIIITSGVRPVWLNNAIGGSRSSAHIDGRAADIQSPTLSPLQICETVMTLNLPVDQCIHEFPPRGWCHLGIASIGERNRGQYLTARMLNGRAVYAIGLNP